MISGRTEDSNITDNGTEVNKPRREERLLVSDIFLSQRDGLLLPISLILEHTWITSIGTLKLSTNGLTKERGILILLERFTSLNGLRRFLIKNIKPYA